MADEKKDEKDPTAQSDAGVADAAVAPNEDQQTVNAVILHRADSEDGTPGIGIQVSGDVRVTEVPWFVKMAAQAADKLLYE